MHRLLPVLLLGALAASAVARADGAQAKIYRRVDVLAIDTPKPFAPYSFAFKGCRYRSGDSTTLKTEVFMLDCDLEEQGSPVFATFDFELAKRLVAGQSSTQVGFFTKGDDREIVFNDPEARRYFDTVVETSCDQARSRAGTPSSPDSCRAHHAAKSAQRLVQRCEERVRERNAKREAIIVAACNEGRQKLGAVFWSARSGTSEAH
jgi:hypothetical protein